MTATTCCVCLVRLWTWISGANFILLFDANSFMTGLTIPSSRRSPFAPSSPSSRPSLRTIWTFQRLHHGLSSRFSSTPWASLITVVIVVVVEVLDESARFVDIEAQPRESAQTTTLMDSRNCKCNLTPSQQHCSSCFVSDFEVCSLHGGFFLGNGWHPVSQTTISTTPRRREATITECGSLPTIPRCPMLFPTQACECGGVFSRVIDQDAVSIRRWFEATA